MKPCPSFLLSLLILLTAACGGRNQHVEGGEGILLAGVDSLMGDDEERAAGFLLDLAFIVDSNMDNPDQAVDRVAALLSVNGEAMKANARTLADRFATMEGPQRRAYEAQFAAYMREANEGWRTTIATFHARHRDAGNQILARLRDIQP